MSASPVFSRSIEVAPEHIDELEHVSNIQYVHWILDAAAAHSEAVGYDLAAYRKLGSVFMVRRHEIDYRESAMLGDGLEVRTWVDSWKGASSVRATSIVRVTDGRELCACKTLWVFVSLASQRPGRIPPQLIEAFTQPA
jgi:acyl-CoA thioester hydrolase